MVANWEPKISLHLSVREISPGSFGGCNNRNERRLAQCCSCAALRLQHAGAGEEVAIAGVSVGITQSNISIPLTHPVDPRVYPAHQVTGFRR